MVYLHSKVMDDLIRHWANESESADNEYATHKIKQLETEILYDEAVDVLPCRYTYEAINEPIDYGADRALAAVEEINALQNGGNV